MQKYLALLKKRTWFFVSFLVLLFAIYVVRAAILMIGDTNRLQSSLSVMNRSPMSFFALGQQIGDLQDMTSNIDNYKLSEIKSALTKTTYLAENARTEFQAQYDSWLLTKDKLTKDKESFLQLRQQLDELQRLQDSEIVRLNKLLVESAKPSFLSDTLALFFSFVVGVLSSILSSHIYDRWKAKR